jgi:hypothetical protein
MYEYAHTHTHSHTHTLHISYYVIIIYLCKITEFASANERIAWEKFQRQKHSEEARRAAGTHSGKSSYSAFTGEMY